ncbi:anti-sigma B factor RsbW [Brevibacillus fulvus]|uniref:Serine-protein kinase RsbW n=1 Tax=Brevibacillus fulvus TaxID=1125967 RepID=A0A938Y1R7_9BACL|nr:anti-sigma B factor RsbW [Brevibacillus fulvus]MBM7591583.1 serine/threonine-protein kinase RsbW [Brevibacillus fulvus]
MYAKENADVVELSLPAKEEYIGLARLLVSGIANRAGLSYDEIEDVKLAVAEACTNVVFHAYNNLPKGQIRLHGMLYPDRLVIVVADQGNSFDFSDIVSEMGPINQEASIEDLKEGGLGLFLIHSLMDEVKISSEAGVVVSMTKYLQLDGVPRNVGGFSQLESE